MNGLKEKRLKRKLTRKAFSNAMDLAEKTIYQYETGKREPNLETLKKMAQFFECTIDELM